MSDLRRGLAGGDSPAAARSFSSSAAFRRENEVVVLFGASGAGKTSVLDCIAGFRPPHHGQYCARRSHRFLQ